MLFEANDQGYIFLILLWIGIITATLDKFSELFCTKIVVKSKLKKILLPICEFLRTISICAIFLCGLYIFNYGEIRLYCIISYIIGIVIAKKLLQKLCKIQKNTITNDT